MRMETCSFFLKLPWSNYTVCFGSFSTNYIPRYKFYVVNLLFLQKVHFSHLSAIWALVRGSFPLYSTDDEVAFYLIKHLDNPLAQELLYVKFVRFQLTLNPTSVHSYPLQLWFPKSRLLKLCIYRNPISIFVLICKLFLSLHFAENKYHHFEKEYDPQEELHSAPGREYDHEPKQERLKELFWHHFEALSINF